MKPQHLVSVSGGKDSTASYLLALRRGVPFRAVFADTGNEHPLTLEYVANLARLTGGPEPETVRADFSKDFARKRAYVLEKWPEILAAGSPGRWQWRSDKEWPWPAPDKPSISMPAYGGYAFKVPMFGGTWEWRVGYAPLSDQQADKLIHRAAQLLERPSGNPFLDLCMMKGRFPSRMAQFCTEELKTLPITQQVVFPMLRAGPVLQWLGIRAEESPNRAKQPVYNRHDSGSMLWRPIFRWTLDDVWAIHREHGIARNALYDQGMNRVGCMPCINCAKEELRQIALRFPEHVARIAEWERIVGDASKRGSATFFAAMTDPTDVDRPGTYADIETVVKWSKTTRGGRQYGMFFDQQTGGGCNSDLAVCEG